MSDPLLAIRDLSLGLRVDGAMRPILENVNLTMSRGEAFGLVGESGSGKSMTVRCITRLLPPGAAVGGEIVLNGRSILPMSRRELRQVRAQSVQMIFQDPRAHINPVRTVGDFLTEALRSVQGFNAKVAEKRVIEILESVWISDPKRRLKQYPHELSGGLLQRVMIASALAAEPELLIADEATTSLDVTTQAEVVALLDELRRERKLGLLFITHDLELAAAICDRTGVMYAGSLVEVQRSATLHERPLHPYTLALLAARPSLAQRARLMTVAGSPVSLAEAPPGCPFVPRCAYQQPECHAARPRPRPFGEGETACLRVGDVLSTSRTLQDEVPS